MVRLGRIPSHHDDRTLRFARYLDTSRLPASPMARDWTHPERAPVFGLFANDRLGDCTCASIAHAFQAQAANNDRSFQITDDRVIDLYSEVSGYDRSRPETDQGAEMIDVLKELRSGHGLAGQHIGAFVQVDPLNREHVDAAVNLCGWLFVGVDLPLATETQTVWDAAPLGHDFDLEYQPNSRGPHAMAMLGYDRLHVVFVTWGGVKVATRRWFHTYCSEAWAVVDSLWIDDTSMLTPSGFDLSQLMRDLVEIDRNK